MLAANPTIAKDKVRTLVGMPCKNPVFWALDAETGRFLYVREIVAGYGRNSLAPEIDAVNVRT
jgi:hypothetical protein